LELPSWLVGADNFVWLDENGNGVQDASEPGVEGVSVTLFTETGTVSMPCLIRKIK
jgi:hypothetical protein